MVSRFLNKPQHPTLTQSEKQNLERFARACGITYAEAVLIRDDLALVKLDLPKLGNSRR